MSDDHLRREVTTRKHSVLYVVLLPRGLVEWFVLQNIVCVE